MTRASGKKSIKKEAPVRVLLFALFYMDFTKDGLRT